MGKLGYARLFFVLRSLSGAWERGGLASPCFWSVTWSSPFLGRRVEYGFCCVNALERVGIWN